MYGSVHIYIIFKVSIKITN